jgi:hypothetical protein
MFASGRARTIEAPCDRRSAFANRREIVCDLSVSRKLTAWFGEFKRPKSERCAQFRMVIEHARADF